MLRSFVQKMSDMFYLPEMKGVAGVKTIKHLLSLLLCVLLVIILTACSGKHAKQVIELKGHTAYVQGALYSPDGKTIVSYSYDRTIRLWDAAAGTEIRQLTSAGKLIRGVRYSADGSRLISWGSVSENSTSAGYIHVWDAASGNSVFQMAFPASVIEADLSPDGKTFVAASSSGAVSFYNVLDSATAGTDERSGVLLDTSTSPTATTREFAADVAVQGFSASTYMEPRYKVSLTEVALLIETCEYDIIESHTQNGRTTRNTVGTGTIERWLYSYNVTVSDLEIGQDIGSEFFPGEMPAECGITAPSSVQNRRSFSLTYNGLPDITTLTTWLDDMLKDKPGRYPPEIARVISTGEEEIGAARFSPDGKLLMTQHIYHGNDYKDVVRIRDAATGELISEFSGGQSIAFCPDSESVVVVSLYASPEIWDIKTGEKRLEMERPDDTRDKEYAACTPDGRFIVGSNARVWDAQTGKELSDFGGFLDKTNNLQFSPEGRFMLSPEGNSVFVRDISELTAPPEEK